MQATVLTISSTLARGEGEDESGPRLAQLLGEAGCDASVEVLPDERARDRGRACASSSPRHALRLHHRRHRADARRRHAEATRAVIEREAPAFQQAMLIEGLRHQPMALLTRGVSGIAGGTLIVNLPGSPRAIDQLFPVLAPRCGTRPSRSCARAGAVTTEHAAVAARGLVRRYGERAGARRTSRSSSPPARRSSSSAPTAPASRRCCACSRRCCARMAARRACSATTCAARAGPCAGGSASSATTRCSTAT